MSKKTELTVCEQQADDCIIVGVSPVMAQAGAMLQAASAQALAIMNQTSWGQSQDTQALANSSKSTTQTLRAGSLKTSARLKRAINALQVSENAKKNPKVVRD